MKLQPAEEKKAKKGTKNWMENGKCIHADVAKVYGGGEKEEVKTMWPYFHVSKLGLAWKEEGDFFGMDTLVSVQTVKKMLSRTWCIWDALIKAETLWKYKYTSFEVWQLESAIMRCWCWHHCYSIQKWSESFQCAEEHKMATIDSANKIHFFSSSW